MKPTTFIKGLISFMLMMCTDSSKTVLFGDSMFSGGSSIPMLLEQWSGHTLDNYALVGASLHDGWVKSIPKQYDSIPNKSNISTIIMDGGGNDVFSMRGDCLTYNQKCQNQIRECGEIIERLLNKMDQEGIHQIIYLGFYYAKGLNRAIDEGMKIVGEVCKEDGNPSCYLVDPRNLSLTFGWDGVHPTTEGYHTLATAIWDTALTHDIQI